MSGTTTGPERVVQVDPPEPELRTLWICPECGCSAVQSTAWISLNPEEILQDEPPLDYFWCPVCDGEQKRLNDIALPVADWEHQREVRYEERYRCFFCGKARCDEPEGIHQECPVGSCCWDERLRVTS